MPPFPTTLTRSQTPADLRLDLTFASNATAETQDTLRLLLGEVVAFVQCGALGGQQLDPSHVSAQASPASVTDRAATQRFSNARLDPGATQCLLNIATWTHHRLMRLNAVRISWDRLPARAEPGAIGFPEAWPQLAYRLDLKASDRRFAIEVNFVKPQPEETLLQINEDLFVWFTAVNRGAYGSSGFAPENSFMSFTDDPVQSLPSQLTWFIDAFHCADAALDGLANTLQKIHHTRAAISHVEIG